MKKYYKGFDKDLQCTHGGKVFQYEVGKTYEEDHANLCQSGFHACEAPLDVFNYYAPGSGSRYCEVALDGVSDERRDDTKVAAKKITIGEEIGIPGLVKAHIEWVKSNCIKAIEKGDTEEVSVGDNCSASVGDRGVSSAGGRGVSSAGWCGVSASRGKSSVGKDGIAAARGNGTAVKGGLGAVLVLIEENKTDRLIKFWKAFRIDGKRYKPDTWYTLDKVGKVVEFEE